MTARQPTSSAQGLQTAPRAFSAAFGLLMAAAAALEADGPAFVAVTLAVIAVLSGLRFRPAATLAVSLTVLAMALSDPSPLFAAIAGLSAAAYLVLRHAASAPAAVATTLRPTLIAAVGFTFIGVIATSVPLQMPWLPLLAPLAIVGIYVLAIRPFTGARSSPAGADLRN
jgi:hypothetical protein